MFRVAVAAVALGLVGLLAAPARTGGADEPKRLTNDELVKMLTNLGYETKVLDKTFTQVLVERADWRSVMRASLSTDGTAVWLDSGFVTLTFPEDVPAETWRKLLAKNEQFAPLAFSVNAKNKRLYLSVSFPNANLTPAELRKQVDALDGQIEKTQPLWKLANFVPPLTPAGEKELAALAGTWAVIEMNDIGEQLAAAEAAKLAYRFDGQKFQLLKDGKSLRSGLLVATPGEKHSRLDRYDTSLGLHGITKRDGDTLTWCYSSTGRPTRFAADAKTATSLIVMTRQK
jgi:uncharacterized protein (TIGR03067 family)